MKKTKQKKEKKSEKDKLKKTKGEKMKMKKEYNVDGRAEKKRTNGDGTKSYVQIMWT